MISRVQGFVVAFQTALALRIRSQNPAAMSTKQPDTLYETRGAAKARRTAHILLAWLCARHQLVGSSEQPRL
jgi:hypothetical protein